MPERVRTGMCSRPGSLPAQAGVLTAKHTSRPAVRSSLNARARLFLPSGSICPSPRLLQLVPEARTSVPSAPTRTEQQLTHTGFLIINLGKAAPLSVQGAWCSSEKLLLIKERIHTDLRTE